MRIFFESTAASIPDDPGEILVGYLAVDPGDVRTEGLELAHDVLVAPIEVIDVVEPRRPPSTEGGNHKRRARADVGHRHRAAMERAGPRHDRAATLHIDVGPELAQFRHVLEAVFEDSLGDMAPSMRLRHQADKGSLQVGRESGMRPGRHVNRLQVPVALYPEAVGPVLDLDAGRPKLEDHGPKGAGSRRFEP